MPPACPGTALTRSESVRAQAWRRRRTPPCSRDRPRQACSFRRSFSCGEHAPARRARSRCSFSRILHVADSSAVSGACWCSCYKCAGVVLGNMHAHQQHLLYHSHTHACTSRLFVVRGFSCTGLFFHCVLTRVCICLWVVALVWYRSVIHLSLSCVRYKHGTA